MIYNSPFELIGNTPLLLIPEEVHGLPKTKVYAKLEYMNPFGSLKDRIAQGMLEPHLDMLKEKGLTVLEASSGNTAKALCILSGCLGVPFKTVTNRIKVPGIRMMLQTLGAEIEELPGLSDCPDPLDPNDYTTVASNLAKSHPDKYFYTDQYFNERNRGSQESTGEEIAADLERVDHFFACLGTCGSSMGAGKVLKERMEDIKIHGVVAAAGHHLPGGRNMEELWEVGFFRKDFYSSIESGTTQEAIDAMLELNRRCGMLCGPTTGLTYHALKEALKQVPSEKERVAVFIACDRIDPYMQYLKQHRPELFSKTGSVRPTVDGQAVEEVMHTEEMTPEKLKQMLDQVLLIDIRGNFAFHRGHIPGSINILNEVFTMIVEEGPSFPERKIVIVCPNGTLSKKYASFLSEQGYEAYSVKKGLLGWRKAGFALEKSKELGG